MQRHLLAFYKVANISSVTMPVYKMHVRQLHLVHFARALSTVCNIFTFMSLLYWRHKKIQYGGLYLMSSSYAVVTDITSVLYQYFIKGQARACNCFSVISFH